MLLALCNLLPTAARAAERANSVLLSVASPAADAAELEAVARELLERLGMQVEMRRVERIDVAEIRQALGPEQAYFARVWIAFAPSGRARLYLEHGESDRVLVREVGGEQDNPELVREELGHILQTAIEGLKAGEAIGAPRSTALQDEPESPQPAIAMQTTGPVKGIDVRSGQPWPRQRVMFVARYELTWLGDGSNFQDGPGAALAAELPAGAFERLGFELSAYYRRPVEVSTEGVGARIQAVSLRAAASAQLWRGQRSGIRLGFGLGADLVHVTPFAEAGSKVALAQSAWLQLALARAHVCYARQLTSFTDLELALGFDLDLKDTRYVVQRAGVERVVLEPLATRPFISLGARVP